MLTSLVRMAEPTVVPACVKFSDVSPDVVSEVCRTLVLRNSGDQTVSAVVIAPHSPALTLRRADGDSEGADLTTSPIVINSACSAKVCDHLPLAEHCGCTSVFHHIHVSTHFITTNHLARVIPG